MAPTVQEIKIAAVRLRRENWRVSVRNGQVVLPRGGSCTYIGLVLAAWTVNTVVDRRNKGQAYDRFAGAAVIFRRLI